MSLNAPRSAMPLLNSLRAFEAAARHQSFLLAARELGVTAGAVAQQVRQLEAWIGRPLFRRKAQGVELAAEANGAASALSGAFEALGCAVQMLRAAASPAQVRIAALPAVAQLWLVPLLPKLRERFEDLEISITALEEPPDFRRELYDLGIFYLRKPPPGTAAIPLSEDVLFPICSPGLCSGAARLKQPEDLRRHILVHDSTWKGDWARWLSQAGVDAGSARHGPRFSLYSMALQAAADGGGVAMGRRTLVRHALERGTFVRPFELEVAAPDTLLLLLPSHRALPERLDLLVDALRENV